MQPARKDKHIDTNLPFCSKTDDIIETINIQQTAIVLYNEHIIKTTNIQLKHINFTKCRYTFSSHPVALIHAD